MDPDDVDYSEPIGEKDWRTGKQFASPPAASFVPAMAKPVVRFNA
jgi:hypothetical protein